MDEYFIAVDVETANSSRASICQIGMISMIGNMEVERWSTLVNPEEEFEKQNTKIHGINPTDCLRAPKFHDLAVSISQRIEGRLILSWSLFDEDCLFQAAEKYSVDLPECQWLDACGIARRVWPSLPSYKLEFVAGALGIAYVSHDAESDAFACAQVALRALATSGTTLSKWASEMEVHIPSSYSGPATVRWPVLVRVRPQNPAL